MSRLNCHPRFIHFQSNEAEAEFVEAGVTVGFTPHIAETVEAGEDLIVAVGGYPRDLRNREKAQAFTLMEAIMHNG